MRYFRILPHIADVRLYVKGDSLRQLFIAALEGMNSILGGSTEKSKASAVFQEIEVSSQDVTTLIIDFLSEVLTRSQILKYQFSMDEIYECNERYFKARLLGCRVSAFEEDVKAVTYHEANVIRNREGNYETTIVFDV